MLIEALALRSRRPAAWSSAAIRGTQRGPRPAETRWRATRGIDRARDASPAWCRPREVLGAAAGRGRTGPAAARHHRIRGTTSPMKLFEYLAVGRPIVASDLVSSTREIFVDGTDRAALRRRAIRRSARRRVAGGARGPGPPPTAWLALRSRKFRNTRGPAARRASTWLRADIAERIHEFHRRAVDEVLVAGRRGLENPLRRHGPARARRGRRFGARVGGGGRAGRAGARCPRAGDRRRRALSGRRRHVGRPTAAVGRASPALAAGRAGPGAGRANPARRGDRAVLQLRR